VTEAGINPLPVQRPIPVWIGGRAEAVADRVGRIGDGWIAIPHGPVEAYRSAVERIRAAARADCEKATGDPARQRGQTERLDIRRITRVSVSSGEAIERPQFLPAAACKSPRRKAVPDDDRPALGIVSGDDPASWPAQLLPDCHAVPAPGEAADAMDRALGAGT
jgi:hypothetical protein